VAHHLWTSLKEHHDKHKNDHNKYGTKEAEGDENVGEDLPHDMFEEGVQNENLDEFLGVGALENMGELVNPRPYHLLEFVL